MIDLRVVEGVRKGVKVLTLQSFNMREFKDNSYFSVIEDASNE